MPWDSPLGPVAELVAACADMVDRTQDAITPTAIIVATPVELVVTRLSSGEVVLGMAPPRQAIATSVMPTLHGLRVRIEASP